MKKFIIALALILAGCSAMKDEKKVPTTEEAVHNIFEAIMSQDTQAIDKLTKAGTNFNIYDSEGYTPLMRIVKFGNSNIAETLIKGGSKIYQPHKTQLNMTAVSMINTYDQEMIRIFEREKNRYGAIIENFITKRQYAEALEFSREHYLPVDLIMPKSGKTALQLMAKLYVTYKKTGKKDQDLDIANYIKYFLKDIALNPDHLEDHEDSLQVIVDAVKNTQLLNDIQKIYANHGKKFQSLKIYKKDKSDPSWIYLKLKVLNDSDQAIPLDKTHRDIYLDTIRSQKVPESSQWLDLVKEVLRSKNEDEDKNQFVKEALDTLLSQVKHDKRYLHSSLELLKTWESHPISVTDYSFDDNMLMVLKSIGLNEYNISILKNLAGRIFQFSPHNPKRSEKSIKFILQSGFNDLQKKALLELISKQAKQMLPQEIVAYAIEVGGMKSVRILVGSGASFNPNEQKSAVSSALLHAPSGEVAHEILVLLKEINIPFNTKFGVQALRITFEKIWEDRESYKKSLNLLLSEPSPLERMSNKGIMNLLIEHLKFVKVKRKNLYLVSQVLRSLKRTIPNTRYVIPITDFQPLGLENIKISFVWHYILTMHSIYKTSNRLTDSTLSLLSDVVSKFPNENVSMAFSGHESNLKPDEFLFQNMIPLSLILSIEKGTIEKALSLSDVDKYKESIESEPSRLSWNTFIKSDFYSYYSDDIFWSSISEVLLKENKDLKLPDDKSTVEFIKVMLYSENFYIFESLYLSQFLANQNISLEALDKICLLDKEEVDKTKLPDLSFESRYNRLVRQQSSMVIQTPVWANLGVFESLRPIKDRSCSLELVSQYEIDFIDNFINTNLDLFQTENPISSSDFDLSETQNKQEVNCTNQPIDEGVS